MKNVHLQDDRPTIGIDASKLAKGFKSGTEYYTQEIIRAMLDLQNAGNKFVLYCKKSIEKSFGEIPRNTDIKVISFPPHLWTQLRLSWEVTLHPPNVLFIPAHTIPPIARCRIITTIHDLGFKHYPHLYPLIERIYHNYSMNQAVKRAYQIIAISEFTKKDILKFYPKVNPNKIYVAHHGFNNDRYRPLRHTDNLKFRPKYNRYILFIGRLEEKKNVLGMIKAYALLRKERRIQHKLVLAGNKKYGFEKVEEYIKLLPETVKKDIIFPGYILDQDLPIILREADLFLFTTLFEGFGMPILEAFASGVPVITSNTTACPEIAGDAALTVNPLKPLDIASACSKILNKPDLRRHLIIKGLHRSKQFTWQVAANKTLKILTNAIKL